MSEHLPKFLAVHFDGDCLEHAAFVESEQEWAQLTCLVSPGDHWDPVLIPIQTAAAAPNLLAACQEAKKLLAEVAEMNIQPFPISAVALNRKLIALVAKATK